MEFRDNFEKEIMLKAKIAWAASFLENPFQLEEENQVTWTPIHLYQILNV